MRTKEGERELEREGKKGWGGTGVLVTFYRG
jgi:hypothetical protein